MSEERKNEDTIFDQWVEMEIWFMRFVGVTLLVIAVASAVFGLFPTDDLSFGSAVRGFNILISLIVAGSGAWALWFSFNEARMVSLTEGFLQQPPGRAFGVGGVQIVIGAFFLISGLRDGGIALLLLGVMMLIYGGWFIMRGGRIKELA